MKTLKAYKFRLYPTEEQKRFFIETFGCVRFTYNTLLKLRQPNERKTAEKMTPAKLKKDYPFLKKTDSLALANAQLNLEKAFKNYYRGRASYPKLKSKKSIWQSYTTNNQQHTIYIEADGLKLPKLKTKIQLHQHRPIEGWIRSATISAKNGQEFYVSILCEEKIEPLPKTGREIKIGYDPQQLVAATPQVEGLEPFTQDKLLLKLTRANRRLACRGKSAQRRKVKLQEAKNYQKQKQRVDQLQMHKLNQKEDFMDQLSIALLRQFDEVVVQTPEDEKQQGNFTLGDWERFMLKLRYKANWYGKELVFHSHQE